MTAFTWVDQHSFAELVEAASSWVDLRVIGTTDRRGFAASVRGTWVAASVRGRQVAA